MAQGLTLVTGACGFIGSHMVDYLISLGYKVRATDLSFAPKTYLNPKAEFIPADLTNKEEVRSLFSTAPFPGIEFVFHSAAVFNFSASRELTYKVNVLGTENLLEVCREFPQIQRIVVLSTGVFYDTENYSQKKFPGMRFSEESPVKPKNFYELSKMEQENLALHYHRKYNLPITVLRPAAVYGSRSHYGAALIIFYIGKGQLAFIPGKGNFPAAIAHVSDVVRAAEFLCQKSQALGEIYNINDDTEEPIRNLFYLITKYIPDTKIYASAPEFLIRLMVKYSELTAKISRRVPRLEAGLIDYVLNPPLMDNRKIKSLGFDLQYPDVMAAVKEVIDWYIPLFKPGNNTESEALELTERGLRLKMQMQEILCKLASFLGRLKQKGVS